MSDKLNQIVRQCWGTETPEDRTGPGMLGEVISEMHGPSVCFRTVDGKTIPVDVPAGFISAEYRAVALTPARCR